VVSSEEYQGGGVVAVMIQYLCCCMTMEAYTARSNPSKFGAPSKRRFRKIVGTTCLLLDKAKRVLVLFYKNVLHVAACH
jgi:hypothetical protein